MKLFASIVAMCLCSSVASAATYTYTLGDHSDGSEQATYDYGLRLDGPGLFYTFQNGNAILTYDDVNLTASVYRCRSDLTGRHRDTLYDFRYHRCRRRVFYRDRRKW